MSAPQSNEYAINLISNEINCVLNEVIVNTTTSDLKLNNNVVSKAILAVAGQSLQDECYRKYRNGITCHEIAITDGFGLRCKKIFHVALPVWNEGTSKDIISQLITKCLTEADNIGAKTIAFPAIGTGKFKYPLDILPRVMYEAVCGYFSENTSNITDVDFVIHPTDKVIMQMRVRASEEEGLMYACSEKKLRKHKFQEADMLGRTTGGVDINRRVYNVE